MATASAQQGVRTTPVIGWAIEQPEYDARVARVRRELERRHLDGLVLFHPIRMAYLSGFFHYSTERPMAIVVGQDGGLGALIPHLEEAHIGRAKVFPRQVIDLIQEALAVRDAYHAGRHSRAEANTRSPRVRSAPPRTRAWAHQTP